LSLRRIDLGPVFVRGRFFALLVSLGFIGSFTFTSWGDARVERLATGDASERAVVEAELVRAGRDGRTSVLAALDHGDYRVRRRACRILLRLADASWLPTLIDRLSRDEPAADARTAIAWTALRLGHGPAEGVVDAELSHAYAHRRLNVVADLEVLRDSGASPKLARALRDESWLVRHRALGALRRLDARPHVAAIASLLADEEAVVRSRALDTLRGLGRVAGEAAYVDGALARALFDPDERARRLAARSIAEGLGSALALSESVVFSLQNDRDAQVRAWLVLALRALPSRDAADNARLADARRDPAPIVRLAAATHDDLTRAFIEVWASDDDVRSEVSLIAAIAAQHAPKPLLDALEAALSEQNADRAAGWLAALQGRDGAWRSAVSARVKAWWSNTSLPRLRSAIRFVAHTLAVDRATEMIEILSRRTAPAPIIQAAAEALSSLASRLTFEERGAALRVLADPRRPLPASEKAALALLAAGPAPDVLPSLFRAPWPRVRHRALDLATQLGAVSVDAVMPLLADPDAEVRAAAVRAVVEAHHAMPRVALASAGPILGSDLGARATAAIAPALSRELRERLRDPAAVVREAAARVLAELGDAEGLRAWHKVILDGIGARESQKRRDSLLSAGALLGDSPAPEILGAVLERLADEDEAVRAAAHAMLLRVSRASLEARARVPDAPARLDAIAAVWWLARHGGTGSARQTRLARPRTPGALLAEAFASLATLDASYPARLGEIEAWRLGRALSERLQGELRTSLVVRFLTRAVAPELLAAWADRLASDVTTRWRASPVYNARRQHLYDSEIARAARAFPGLPPKILKALLLQESNLEPLAGNTFNCVGLAAFCTRAAKEEGLVVSRRFRDFANDDRYDPAAAVRAAVRHLRRKARLLEEGPFARFGAPRGRDYWAFVLAAYNGGHAQVAAAMERAHEHGAELAESRGLEGPAAQAFAKAFATRWENLLLPEESPEDSPLYEMTEARYAWYRPYGRYRRMSGAEAKYHEIAQFPLDILDRADERSPRTSPPARATSPREAAP
jgi:HEAT repeat protein